MTQPTRHHAATRERPTGRDVAAGGALALALLAAYNAYAAQKAEARNPPEGQFVEADGLHLHFITSGPRGEPDGPPVVLLHGNVVTATDWAASGVLARVAARRRVIAFDRPGFGYSDRPRGSAWGPEAQARLLAKACDRLGLERPVVVGHSWGALVARAWAQAMPDRVSGVVLASGYYFPTPRLDAAFVVPAALPVVGDVLRHTVSPPFTRVTLPGALKGMFAPQPVPARFEALYSHGMMARPSQIRAAAQEGMTMVPAVMGEQAPIRCPAALVAGTKDVVVDPYDQTARLARQTPGATLRLVEGAGHMVHHAAPDVVAAAALSVGQGERARAAA